MNELYIPSDLVFDYPLPCTANELLKSGAIMFYIHHQHQQWRQSLKISLRTSFEGRLQLYVTFGKRFSVCVCVCVHACFLPAADSNRQVSAAALDQPMYWKGLHKACAHTGTHSLTHTHSLKQQLSVQCCRQLITMPCTPQKKKVVLKSGLSPQPH